MIISTKTCEGFQAQMGEFMKQSHTIINGLHCLHMMRELAHNFNFGCLTVCTIAVTVRYTHNILGTYKRLCRKDLITLLCALLHVWPTNVMCLSLSPYQLPYLNHFGDQQHCLHTAQGVYIRWNGMMEWNSGMDYWNGGMLHKTLPNHPACEQ